MTQERNISPQQAHAWLVSGEAVLIDVRQEDEFKEEHIAYALSFPLAQIDHLFDHLQFPSERKIIFQCLRGKRGEQACAVVKHNPHHPHVYNITGGIDAWKNDGLPVISMKAPKISLFRQVQIIIGFLILAATVIGFCGHVWGFAVAGFFGAALFLTGLIGWCGLALLLAKAPWNK